MKTLTQICRKDSRRLLKQLAKDSLSRNQRALKKKHGTPAEFAVACYKCVPGWISMDEARAAVEKYNAEWNAAGQ